MIDPPLDFSDAPVVEIPVAALHGSFSPRRSGYDEEMVRTLAETDGVLPPILVQLHTNRIIDGVHRLLAARIRGEPSVRGRFHDCDDTTAFVLAVRLNVVHGLPLTLADRKAAAGRILQSHTHWSDRRIAATAGLSDKTVATIRRQSRLGSAFLEHTGQARIGIDGRSRPLDAGAQRDRVNRLLTQSPRSSLREIAKAAGVSPETVRVIKANGAGAVSADSPGGQRSYTPDVRRCLEVLMADPALRSTDNGRALLRLLSALPLLAERGDALVDSVPEHDLALFGRLAAENAALWTSLAEQANARHKRSSAKPRHELRTAS